MSAFTCDLLYFSYSLRWIQYETVLYSANNTVGRRLTFSRFSSHCSGILLINYSKDPWVKHTFNLQRSWSPQNHDGRHQCCQEDLRGRNKVRQTVETNCWSVSWVQNQRRHACLSRPHCPLLSPVEHHFQGQGRCTEHLRWTHCLWGMYHYHHLVLHTLDSA